jgi:hypothetical protein
MRAVDAKKTVEVDQRAQGTPGSSSRASERGDMERM